jgi:hypothetical protein
VQHRKDSRPTHARRLHYFRPCRLQTLSFLGTFVTDTAEEERLTTCTGLVVLEEPTGRGGAQFTVEDDWARLGGWRWYFRKETSCGAETEETASAARAECTG